MEKIISFLAIMTLSLLCLNATGIASAAVLVDADLPENVYIEIVKVWNAKNDDNAAPSLEELFFGSDGDGYNWLFMIKEYTSLESIDIPFLAEPSGGTTEYLFIEGLINFTGETWTDYHVELGVDWGEGFTRLSELGLPSVGLDFDTPDKDPAPSAFFLGEDDFIPIFSQVNHYEDLISWHDGQLPSYDPEDFGDLAFLTFSIDVPDIPETEDYNFIIRQYPTTNVIPEPTSIALFGIGLLGLARLKRGKYHTIKVEEIQRGGITK
jgi:hypothetical protein